MGLSRALFILAASALAATAHASYGQMRLEGVALLLVFLATLAWVVLVNLALLARIFRHRWAVAGACVVALALILLLLGLAASPDEREAFSKGMSGGLGIILLAVTVVVLLPFAFVAPIAQNLSLLEGRRWPWWIGTWMKTQLALLPAFVALGFTEHHFWQQEFEAAQVEGRQVAAGELGALLEHAEQRRERIWGTAWSYPWRQKAAAESYGPASGWILGIALGLDASALIATDGPLAAPDRAALDTLVQRHFVGFAVPRVRVKLVWDSLEPGHFAGKLDPRAVSEEGVPVLLERLAKGGSRLCPGGRMQDADRAALNELLSGMAQTFSMRPPWDEYLRRGERVCSGPG